jgi:competence protein ComEC
VGDARLSVLHPKPGFSAGGRAYAAENNRSLVVSVEVGERTLLFPGDVQAEAEAALLASSGAVRCDVLKVAHHGGKTSSTEPFLRTARPSIAVISLEKDNWYGQPGDEVLERFYSIGARLYRTDRDGAVTVREDGKGMRVTAWADRLLLRIRLKDPASWVEIERENWRRLRLRARGI